MTNWEKVKQNLTLEKFRYDRKHAITSICTIVKKIGGKCGHSCEECCNWLAQEYREPILDEIEKEYLSNVLKPFRNRVKYIVKEETLHPISQYIVITLVDVNKSEDYLIFPSFELDSMYKNMKPYKEYTLEELGI